LNGTISKVKFPLSKWDATGFHLAPNGGVLTSWVWWNSILDSFETPNDSGLTSHRSTHYEGESTHGS
jgi:hypothetical protein